MSLWSNLFGAKESPSPSKRAPSSVMLAQTLLVVSVAQGILNFVVILLSPNVRSHLTADVWVRNAGFWIVWLVLVALLGRRQGWARFAVLAMLAWNVRNVVLFLLNRPTGAPPTWLLSQLPAFFWIQIIGSVVLCIVFWTSWQRGKQVPVFWLWIAVGVCSLPASGRGWWSLQIFFTSTALRLCGALLLFKRESNGWFRMKLPQTEAVSATSRTDLAAGLERTKSVAEPEAPAAERRKVTREIAVRTESKDSELILAAQDGNADLVRALLEKGADINASKNTLTALMLASQNGHLNVVELLLARGAHVNASMSTGDTAIILASQRGRAAVVQALIDKLADVNAKRTQDGTTALHQAAQKGDREVVQKLLVNGADVNARRSDDGTTALHLASWEGHHEVVRALLARGADVEAKRSDSGATALILASLKGHRDVVLALLEKGADVNAKRGNDEQPR